MPGPVLFIPSVEDNGSFCLYVLSLEKDGNRWDVRKRYSELHSFYQAISHECSGMENQFPGKRLGKLNAEQTERRRQQLEAFMKELLEMMLTPAVKVALYDFLEIRLHTDVTPLPPPPPVRDDDGSSASANDGSSGGKAARGDSAASGGVTAVAEAPKPTWSDSYMSSDPLAQFETENKPPPKARAETPPKRAVSPQVVKPPTSPPVSTTTRPTNTHTTVFMSSTKSQESYPVTGNGFREAVMNKDVRAVKYLLEKDPSLVDFQDRQAETMLHLACIFNLTDIALALVEAGASVEAKNSHDETPVDVAQPALKLKVLQAARNRSGGTT